MRALREAVAGLVVLTIALGAGAASVTAEASRVTGELIEARTDAATFNGYRRYHAICSHCHGPAGLGSSFAPGLLERTRDLPAFRAAVLGGIRNGKSVMKGFAGDPNVAPYLDDLYAYLSARRDGTLGPGRPQRRP